MEPLVEPTMERWFTQAFRDAKPPVLDKVRGMIRETSVEGYIGCGRAIQNLYYLPRLSQIKLPTLFVAGAQDLATPPDAMKAMHEAVPGSQYALIDPAGHLSNIENPDAFMRAVGGFLQAH
jgi:3-oxoadipate enol-lactonase